MYQLVAEDGTTYPLNAPMLTMGRENCDIELEGNTQLSRQHARFEWQGEDLTVEDLGSTNGTYVNGERVTEKKPIKPGDILQLGTEKFTVSAEEEAVGATVAVPIGKLPEQDEAAAAPPEPPPPPAPEAPAAAPPPPPPAAPPPPPVAGPPPTPDQPPPPPPPAGATPPPPPPAVSSAGSLTASLSATPGKFQAIVYMQLIAGILALLMHAIAVLFSCFTYLLLITPIYGIVVGVMATLSGVKALRGEPKHDRYRTVAIMQIIAIIAFDPVSCVCGILGLIFLNDPEVKQYLEN